MKCSQCGLFNPDSAQRCDCGYEFLHGSQKESYLTQNELARGAADAWAALEDSTPHTAMGRTWRALLPTSVFAGAAATVTFYAARKALVLLGHLHPFENGMEDQIWLAFPAFLLAGYLIGFRLSVQWQSADVWPAGFVGLVAANGGIVAGVIIWLGVEELIFKRFGVFPVYEEHNLFPIEIIILWVLAAVPLILGMGLGYVVSGFFRRRDAR